MRTMAAGEFKAKCLAVMDDVKNKRETVLLTKHGEPWAKLVPLDNPDELDPLAAFRYPGLKIVGDIEAPLYTDEEWEGFFEASASQLK